jgi:hypothetical protein
MCAQSIATFNDLVLLKLHDQALSFKRTTCLSLSVKADFAWHDFALQQKEILERKLPENLKLSIAKQIENNLFTKVRPRLFEEDSCLLSRIVSYRLPPRKSSSHHLMECL